MTRAVGLTLLLCGALLISWRWRPRQTAEGGVWMLLACYALLGGWALWFGLYSAPGREPPGFLLWKPTVMYWALSTILIVAPQLGFGYPVKAVLGTYFAWSGREWRLVNLALATLFGLLGLANLLVAFNLPREDWVGFKFSCMVNVLGILLLRLNFVWLDTLRRIIMYLYGRARALFP